MLVFTGVHFVWSSQVLTGTRRALSPTQAIRKSWQNGQTQVWNISIPTGHRLGPIFGSFGTRPFRSFSGAPLQSDQKTNLEAPGNGWKSCDQLDVFLRFIDSLKGYLCRRRTGGSSICLLSEFLSACLLAPIPSAVDGGAKSINMSVWLSHATHWLRENSENRSKSPQLFLT